MARTRSMKAIDEKITENESKLQKMKARCDKLAQELDSLYEEKKQIEDQQVLAAIRKSVRTKAEIMAFLGSQA